MENFSKVVGVNFFELLSHEYLNELKNIGIRRKFGKNKRLFNEGDRSNGFFCILQGQVRVFKVTLDGNEQPLAMLEKGDAFGFIPFIMNQPFYFGAVTNIESELLYFPRKKFMNLLSGDAGLATKLLSVASEQLKLYVDMIALLSKQKTETRIAAYILGLAEKQKTYKNIKLDIMKGDIANLLGITPETLSRVFLKMINKKIIELDRKNVIIRDIEKLKELADNIALK